MDGQHPGLPVTIHLLVSKESLSVFHQAIDRLLQVLCIDSQPFQVSERVHPVPRYGCQKRKCEFPGISVTLFLREDLGEERISLLQSFFQLPPWDHVNIDLKLGRSWAFSQAGDFYCLDTHTPVWGIRPVLFGFEILRVTLYCTCDNYEDTVQLYETILGMEATSQNIGFCFFVLYSTKHTTIQLSLKQLPPGVAVQVKEACALQFSTQAIGQLVPLLPYPCVPISDIRWQTQDYDGNKILILVVGSKVAEANQAITFKPPVNPLTTKSLTLAQPTKSTPKEEHAGEVQHHTFPKSSSTSSQREMCPIRNNSLVKAVPVASLQRDETEMNVDTGDRFMEERHQSRDLQRSAICRDNRSLPAGFKADRLLSTSGDSKSLQAVKQNKGADISSKILYLQRSQRCHSNGTRLGEEFFI